MYSFRDTNEHKVDILLPSVAMTFNGKIFENQIEGYRTLTVSGREVISSELITHTVQNGTITTSERLPPRFITVQYSLEEKDNQTFQENFKKLRKHLTTKKEVFFSFEDDPTTFFIGRLSVMEQVNPSSNAVVSSFVLFCGTPFKFGPLSTTTGPIAIETFYDTPPLEMKVTVSTSTETIKITNGVQEIGLTGNFKANDKIVLNVEQGIITKNGSDYSYSVNLDSDFENFLIEKGQTVSSPQGAVVTTARERWL